MTANIQEQEEADFQAGADTESRNCLFEARQRMSVVARINNTLASDAIALGRFVVQDTQPYYCSSTDAVAGTVDFFCGDYATREEAEVAAATIAAGEDRFPFVRPCGGIITSHEVGPQLPF